MAEYYHFDEDGRLAADGPDGWEPPPGRWKRVPSADDLLIFRRHHGHGAADGPRAVLTGDLEGFHVVELLGYLAQSRWTGALALAAGDQERRLRIRRGRLVQADSNAYAHRLGQVLRALHLVDREVLDRELEAVAEEHGDRLGRRLVADGILTEEGLATAVQRRLEEIFYDLLERGRGLFFLFNEPVEDDEEDPDLDLNFLLMEGLRRIDETRRFREVIPHDEVWVVPTESPPPEDPGERQLWEAVGDGVEWGRLREELGVFEFDLAERVLASVEAGHLLVREDPPPPGGATGVAWETARRMDALLAEVFDALPVEARPEVAEAVDWFLSDGDHGQEAVLQGLSLRDDGTLPVGDLVANLEAAGGEAQDALEELTFFLLMQAGRHLGYKANQRLSRRVHAALKKASEPASRPQPPARTSGANGHAAQAQPASARGNRDVPAVVGGHSGFNGQAGRNGHRGNGTKAPHVEAPLEDPDPFPDLEALAAPESGGESGHAEALAQTSDGPPEEDGSENGEERESGHEPGPPPPPMDADADAEANAALIHAAFAERLRDDNDEQVEGRQGDAHGEREQGDAHGEREQGDAHGEREQGDEVASPEPDAATSDTSGTPEPPAPVAPADGAGAPRPAWQWPEPGDVQPPRERATGLLEVQSEPAGAWVYLDGHRLGRTPLSHLKPHGAGAHKLEVRLTGWKIWSRTVMLSGSGPSRFEVHLHPAEAQVHPP